MSTVINLGEFNVASVDRFYATITKDGVPWNLSTVGSGVQLTFKAPDRISTFTVDMTPDNAALGTFYYDTVANPPDIATAGYWTVRARVTDTSVTPNIIKTYPYEIGFHANDESD